MESMAQGRVIGCREPAAPAVERCCEHHQLPGNSPQERVHEYFNRLPEPGIEPNGHVTARAQTSSHAVNAASSSGPEIDLDLDLQLDQQQGKHTACWSSRSSVVLKNSRASPSSSCLTAIVAATESVIPEPESPDTILEEGLAAANDDFEPLLVSRQQHHHHSAVYSFSRFQEKVNAHLPHHHHHHHHHHHGSNSGPRFRNNRVDSYNGSLCDAFLGRLAVANGDSAVTADNETGVSALPPTPSNSFSLEEGLHLYDRDDIIMAAAAGIDCTMPPRYPEAFQILSNNDSEINLELSASASEPDLVRAVAAAIAELAADRTAAAATTTVKKKHVSINTDPPPTIPDGSDSLRPSELRRGSSRTPSDQDHPLRSSLKQHCKVVSAKTPLASDRRRLSSRQRTSCYEMVEFGVNPFEMRLSSTPATARQVRRKSSCLCWSSGEALK